MVASSVETWLLPCRDFSTVKVSRHRLSCARAQTDRPFYIWKVFEGSPLDLGKQPHLHMYINNNRSQPNLIGDNSVGMYLHFCETRPLFFINHHNVNANTHLDPWKYAELKFIDQRLYKPHTLSGIRTEDLMFLSGWPAAYDMSQRRPWTIIAI